MYMNCNYTFISSPKYKKGLELKAVETIARFTCLFCHKNNFNWSVSHDYQCLEFIIPGLMNTFAPIDKKAF